MQKGEIVRKLGANSQLIGPYMKVTDARSRMITARSLSSDRVHYLLFRKQLKVVSFSQMMMTRFAYHKIITKACTSIIHDYNLQLKSIMDKNAEVLRVYTCDRDDGAVYIKVLKYQRLRISGNSVVRIDFEYLGYEN